VSIQKRPSPDGKKTKYVVRWRAKGQERSKSFVRLAEARTFDTQVHQSLDAATYVDPRAGKMTLEVFARDWLDHHACAPSTKAKYRSLLDAQIIPALGGLPLDQITPYKVNRFLGGTGKAASTVRSIAALVSSLSLAAVEDERIKKTFMPFRLSLPRAKADERIYLDHDQVHAIVDAAADREKALIYTAAWTGLRWGELVGLKRDRLDLQKGTIEVREALVDVGGHLSLAPPKTPGSRRTVTLTTENVALLKHHVLTYPPGQYTLVFSTERRGPIRDDNWRKRVWKPLVEKVPTVSDKTRFHDLRHTHAALCIQAEMNLKSIQTRLGHSSIRVTGDRYAHLLQAVEERDVAALNALSSPEKRDGHGLPDPT
jgi:integrase